MPPHAKTLVFCTAYTHPLAGRFYTWTQRYRRWVEAFNATKLAYDQLLLIDDGSESLPDWPDLKILTDGHDLHTDAPLVLYHFSEHLGRKAVDDFPGWVRSFFFAATYAKANGFEKIIHLEADAFLISERIQNYANAIQEGWVSMFCPLFRRPESAIQIIAGTSVQDFCAFAAQPLDALKGVVIETVLPFTLVEHGFVGDRYGEYLDYIPATTDWCAQAVANGRLAADSYFWWLPKLQTPVAPSVLPILTGNEMADCVNHGMWYVSFFSHFNRVLGPRTYFEIGTHAGDSLRAFSCTAVCVDPRLLVTAEVIGARRRTYLCQDESDVFFASGDMSRLLPDGFDVAFLDGLHLAEVLLRDFINAERHSRPDSVIFLHDCLPLNLRMAERDRRTDPNEDEATRDFWTGDVWKVARILHKYRPNLTMRALDCAPTGLVACTNLDASDMTLSNNYDAILAELADMDLATIGLADVWRMLPIVRSQSVIDDEFLMHQMFGPGWHDHTQAEAVP